MRRVAAWLVVLGFATTDARAQNPLPAGWPTRLELGMADGPGGAAAMKNTAPFGFRYQYLAGGANTGGGWATWNTNGDFAKFYIQDSVANGIIPVFTYYMLLQSLPGGGSESNADFTNLNNTATMTAYFNDLTLFFQKAGAFPTQKIVLHVEPDFWGYMEQRAANDDARTVAAKIAETGIPQLAGLPGNVSGFARAIVALRDAYAPNVILGYHISVWGTNIDIAISNPSDATVDALGARAAAFYTSLGANFDIAFGEFSDRDSGYYQFVVGDSGRSWWDAEDFRRNVRFLSKFSTIAGKRIVMWQIPLGNTRMRSANNTTGHYQDNRPEWLLDDAGAHAPVGVPRRRRGRVSVRRRSGRDDVRLRRPTRRRDESGSRSTATAWRRSWRRPAPRRPRWCAAARRRSSHRMRRTMTAGSSGGARGSTTRTAR